MAHLRHFRLQELSHKAFYLYVTLCGYADANGACWPGTAALMDDLSCSRATIFRARAELKTAALLTWSRTGRTNRYTVWSPSPNGCLPGDSPTDETEPPVDEVSPDETSVGATGETTEVAPVETQTDQGHTKDKPIPPNPPRQGEDAPTGRRSRAAPPHLAFWRATAQGLLKDDLWNILGMKLSLSPGTLPWEVVLTAEQHASGLRAMTARMERYGSRQHRATHVVHIAEMTTLALHGHRRTDKAYVLGNVTTAWEDLVPAAYLELLDTIQVEAA